ncbi:conserved membrane hypothetical protein [uncultured Alphaproteobacteria bacterium]|uniref:Flippase-like domain-containing protein n=1 Tax=uncultured Alphaproteobacteria bacterium TaxID=91750 RepID=A0A212JES4_9PROT|nr:conserved membrane hypothetical protein [uncultured Alphaproteobacteria bacterium]
MMKRLVGLCVSFGIVAVLWWRVDVRAIAAAARDADPVWLASGLAMVVPLTLVTAWRFGRLADGAVGVGTAIRLVLSASTLNLVMPSKMGDIAKSWVLIRRHGFSTRHALALVGVEKVLDFASLLVWGAGALFWVGIDQPWVLLAALAVVGLLGMLLLLILPVAAARRLLVRISGLLPGRVGHAVAAFLDSWEATVSRFWARPGRALGILGVSVALWGAHLAQFWLFARALDVGVPFVDNMAFATLAILAGLLPLTIAGVGTRDAAIVVFYAPWLAPSQGAVLGMLATMRYVIPAVAGLPFLRDYWPGKIERDI